MTRKPEIIIIGAGVVDVLVSGVDTGIFSRHSTPADGISMQTGGDALNESMVLGKLGRAVRLVSRVGTDKAGELVLSACEQSGVDTSGVVRKEGLDTGVNVVLVSENGERSFITNPNGALRKIEPEDVFAAIESHDFAMAKIASFASIFVYPLLMPALEEIFSAIKAKGLILCADMTRPKHGETVEDLKGALRYVDYLFPNYQEASQVTGKTDIDDIADCFLEAGVKNIVIKLGSRGCFIKNSGMRRIIPAVPGISALDTTGAGDNFAAGFINGLLDGMSLEGCARFANAVASICVERIGAASGGREIGEILRRADMIPANE